jgi:outer membrane protein TolC
MLIRLNKIVGAKTRIWLCVWVAVLGAIGCGSPNRKVGEHLGRLREAWQTNLEEQAHLRERVLEWTNAVELVLQHNLKLVQARIELTNAQENVRQVYKDLIPTLNARAGISKQLSQLANLSENDLTLSADSFFNVPGVISFGSRLYAARLYQLRAQAAYELAEREQLIELYRLFFSADELRDESTRLEMQRATAIAMQQVDPFSGRLMQTELETRELAFSREVKGFQDRASEVLGSRASRWVFSTNGLPLLRYQQNPLPLGDTNRVAQLQMRLLAVELEAARAQILGMKLRYWPELNIFITSPPLYQKQFGQERFWDSEEVRASADLFWTIDTRGNNARMIRQTVRQQDLQIQRYQQESLTLMNRLLYTQQIIDTVQKQLERVESQLALLLAIPPAQNYTAIEKYSIDYRTLTLQQLQLKRELSDLNALFWFVDEAAWSNHQGALSKT